jgi:hypothetical protein
VSPNDRVAKLYPQEPNSLFITFYESPGYVGGILTRLHGGTKSRSCSQKITCHLQNPKVCYRFHKSPSPLCALCQMNPAHALERHISRYIFIINYPSVYN